MPEIVFYLDFISPYAYLAFERLPQALAGCSYSVRYQPVLFAGLLKHHGQLGPAEIGPKRAWTYRQVLWLAQHHGIELQLPAAHPFNPLGVLRLAYGAAAARGAQYPNRLECERIFNHVWRSGLDAADPQRLAQLSADLLPAGGELDTEQVKHRLMASTEAAIARGVFGVPTLECDQRQFWGQDALPMLRDALSGHPWFDSSAWGDAQGIPVGTARKPHRENLT